MSVAFVDQVRKRILAVHRDHIRAVIDAGEDVAEAADQRPISDPDQIRIPLEGILRQRGLLDPMLGMLETGSEALGEKIQGKPVTAAPYLVVTSRGPVCRVTLSSGQRLVIELQLFSVENRPRHYEFRAPTPETCLKVQCQRQS